MQIPPKSFAWPPSLEGPMRIYLAQLESRLDPEPSKKGRLVAVEEKRRKIEALLDLIIQRNTPFNIVVLPEISTPVDHVIPLTLRFTRELPNWTICILGIELISVEEARQLSKALPLEGSETEAALGHAQAGQLVNLCLLCFKEEGKTRFFLQPKMTASKFEGNLHETSNLARSDFVYHFHSPYFSFLVIICSDLFNRAAGNLPRIIDEIDFNLLKRDMPIDFIFNIQYNRRPDDGLFLHSLRRLYDDGSGAHGKLCVFLLNSLLEGADRGGQSKVLFHESLKIPDCLPIKQIDVPAKGYEFPAEEVVMSCVLDRLPRSWNPRSDTHSVHLQAWRWNGDIWAERPTPGGSFLMALEKEPIRDFRDYESVAREFSRLGDFEQAIAWFRKAANHWEERWKYLEAAAALRQIGHQYRHQGKFQLARQAYAKAENLALHETSPEARFLTSKIQAGRVMVEQYLLKGECLEADRQYASIIADLEEYVELQGNEKVDEALLADLRLNKLHAKRQQAEMRRITGRYRDALQMFEESYGAYDYCLHEEKANAALGMAESYRMLGMHAEAEEKFGEVIRYAEAHKAKRLLARTLRSQIELYRLLRRDVNEQMNRLKQLSEDTTYLFGNIWWNLLSGAIELTRSPEASASFFVRAKELTQVDGQRLTIEYAHATLGMAETERVLNCGGLGLFEEALGIYKSRSIIWGVVRGCAGKALCGASLASPGDLVLEWREDSSLLKRVRTGEFGESETLFWNMP